MERNSKDYSVQQIARLVEMMTPEHLIERASWTHFYLISEAEKIIGCGAIGPYWGKEDESSLLDRKSVV